MGSDYPTKLYSTRLLTRQTDNTTEEEGQLNEVPADEGGDGAPEPVVEEGAAQIKAPAAPDQPEAQPPEAQPPEAQPPAGMDVLARLANALEAIGGRERAPTYKAPKYSGLGDVEYLLDQFHEVAKANGWNNAGTLIHLQESLMEDARECGRSPTLQGVEDGLRSRFGMTPREARAKLALCKKATKTSLQQHADDVSQLVQRGYADLENQQSRTLAVEAFINSLGNHALQRHLLAINPPNLPTAVKACNEFLSVKDVSSSSMGQVEDRKEATNVRALTAKDRESLDNLAKTVQELVKQVAGLKTENAKLRQSQQTSQRPTNKKASTTCWGWRKEGHQRKNCQTHPWPAA